MIAVDRKSRLPSLNLTLTIFTFIVVSLLSILLLDPINGAMPGIALDLSWPYTLADATARQIPFGRDMVFTFGPLSSIYSHAYLPDQRLAVVAFKAILVLTFCSSAVAISRPRVRWVALALPVILANLLLSDPFFLVAPWLLVALAANPMQNRFWYVTSLSVLSAVLGPLLLVKGSFTVPLIISVGAAAFIVSRRNWAQAVALPCAALVSIVGVWIATGQKLFDLLFYLRRSAYVASGYTNAMSVFGDSSEIWAYLTGAVVLVASLVVPRRAPLMTLLTAIVILFVAFKAGFVRHDGHSNIAGGTLALLGLLLFLSQGTLAAGVGLFASLSSWILIAGNYWPIDPASNWSRMVSVLNDNVAAIRAAEVDPGAFRRSFEAAKAEIAVLSALPETKGIVDLYPNAQAVLLASNREYYPRPVMQSYSAYTPELAFLNAEHLEGARAPQTVFFSIDPIDTRYPAMEDGLSWPALLGHYRFRSYAHVYAVLDRVPSASAGTVDPPTVSGTPRFGDTLTVPQNASFIWSKMQFHPTLLGRIISALFKLPLINMDVTTEDGQTKTFRVVPGMAGAGFLLSPEVSTAHDFVALRSTATDALAKQRVTTIKLHVNDSLGLWGKSFSVQFAPLRIPIDPAVDEVVLGRLDDGPQVDDLPAAGECTIDAVGSSPVTLSPIAVTGRTVMVTGWGFVSAATEGRDGGDLRLAVTPLGGATVYAKAERQPRPDVDIYFHLSKPTSAGFVSQVNLSAIDGPATLRVVQETSSGLAVCGPIVEINR